MSLIRFHDVSKGFDSGPVLRNVFFRLDTGDRVGLIGKNGSGKTTTLRLILGEEEPEAGRVQVDGGARVGYFSQFSQLRGESSAVDILGDLFSEIRDLEKCLALIEGELGGATGEGLETLLQRQASLLEEMDRREGWTYQNRIETVLSKLGFNGAHRCRPIDQLSGGWRNRAALAELLLGEHDVLLMDEPTDFLDVDGLEGLEAWFAKHTGGLVLVSHDRNFLDNVANRVVEVENYSLQEYRGNLTEYVREKRVRIKKLERHFEHEEELLAYEAEAIADQREAARDPSAALRKRLSRIKKMAEPRPMEKIVTGIYEGLKVSQQLCIVENLSKTYDHQTLFTDLSFTLHKGQRTAILGPNGCGKTTLLRVLTGDEAPDSGDLSWTRGGDYVSYDQILTELDPNDTVTHAVNIHGLGYHAPRKAVNRFLALLQFSEMDLYQKLGTLSGGQRARIALAKWLLSGALTVLLDEPTNHLDLTSTQVMERALLHFPGAVVVVSHDRFFVDKIATRLLVFEGDGRVSDINGNWTIWRASGWAE